LAGTQKYQGFQRYYILPLITNNNMFADKNGTNLGTNSATVSTWGANDHKKTKTPAEAGGCIIIIVFLS